MLKIFLILLSLVSSSFAGEIYFALKKNKVNVRTGPSFDASIKFIYKKKDYPIRQIDKKENFRRIIDFKNNSGWIHVSQLKKNKSLITLDEKILFKKPSKFSTPLAKIKKGRVLLVKKCHKKWCKIKSGIYNGWIKTNNVWGFAN